ncbi:MAG: hypothetical protein ACJAV6_000145 [Candidatus Paceibacteria bacterium]|jgi:hypothetical protein
MDPTALTKYLNGTIKNTKNPRNISKNFRKFFKNRNLGWMPKFLLFLFKEELKKRNKINIFFTKEEARKILIEKSCQEVTFVNFVIGKYRKNITENKRHELQNFEKYYKNNYSNTEKYVVKLTQQDQSGVFQIQSISINSEKIWDAISKYHPSTLAQKAAQMRFEL